MTTSGPPTPDDQAYLAISRFFDGDRSDQLIGYLQDQVLSTPEGAELFVRMSIDHHRFYELMYIGPLSRLGLVGLDNQEGDEHGSLLSDLSHFEQAQELRLVDLTEREAAQAAKADRAPAGPIRPMRDGPRLIVVPRWLAAAAVVGLVLSAAILVYTLFMSPHGSTPGGAAVGPAPERAVPEAVGVELAESFQARWEGHTPGPGALESDRPLRLQAGVVRLVLDNQTHVLIEGPARFTPREDNSLAIDHGRLTADVSVAGHGFTVRTPDAEVIDLGTSFGVEVSESLGTITEVLEGEVVVAPGRGGERANGRTLLAGQAARVEVGGVVVHEAVAHPERFLRQDAFRSLLGENGEQAYEDQVREMWRRDASLLAAASFMQSHLAGLYGLSTRVVTTGSPNIDSGGSLSSAEGMTAYGGRLHFANDYASAVFFDIDCGPRSLAARAGVVDPRSGMIGRPGTRLCISWCAGAAPGRSQALSDQEWFGLSLFAGGDNRYEDELLFLGLSNGVRDLAAYVRRNAADEIDPGLAKVAIPHDGSEASRVAVHRWLIVIDFADGADRVAVYLDPADAARLGKPGFELNDIDVSFDRLRVEANLITGAWSFDELRVGTTVDSVLLN